jgi:6-phosphogluconolactonase
MYRVTMTAKLINQAANILFLVEGTGKAGILNTILNAPYQPDQYPAQLIKPADGNLHWFADSKAAVLLHKS